MARAPVSKTGGCRFESCHSCQAYQALARLSLRTKGVQSLALDPSWTQSARTEYGLR
jgi:hypothetical protein